MRTDDGRGFQTTREWAARALILLYWIMHVGFALLFRDTGSSRLLICVCRWFGLQAAGILILSWPKNIFTVDAAKCRLDPSEVREDQNEHGRREDRNREHSLKQSLRGLIHRRMVSPGIRLLAKMIHSLHRSIVQWEFREALPAVGLSRPPSRAAPGACRLRLPTGGRRFLRPELFRRSTVPCVF